MEGTYTRGIHTKRETHEGEGVYVRRGHTHGGKHKGELPIFFIPPITYSNNQTHLSSDSSVHIINNSPVLLLSDHRSYNPTPHGPPSLTTTCLSVPPTSPADFSLLYLTITSSKTHLFSSFRDHIFKYYIPKNPLILLLLPSHNILNNLPSHTIPNNLLIPLLLRLNTQ